MQIDTVVGNSTDTRWSQVHSTLNAPVGGSLLVVVDVQGAELMDLPMYGSGILESVRELYYSGQSYGLAHLRSVVNKVLSETVDGLKVSLIAASVNENVLHVVGEGGVRATLVRGDSLHALLIGTEEISSVSGELNEEDVFVVGTSDFFSYVDDQLVGAVNGDGIPSEILAPIIHGKDDSSGSSALLVAGPFVSVDKKEKKRVVSVGSRVGGIVSKLSFLKLPSRPLTISRPKDGKRSRVLGLLVLGILVLSVVFGVWRRSSIVKERAYNELEQSVQQQLDEARVIADLNPERARYLLGQSRQATQIYLADVPNDAYKLKGEDLLGRIDSVEEEALKKSEIEVTPYIDISVIAPELSPSSMYLDEDGSVYFWDRRKGIVHGLQLSDKSSFRVGGSSSFVGVVSVGVFDDTLFAYVGERVVSHAINEGEGEVEEVIGTDDTWGEIKFLKMYAGNVYLIDTGIGEIWKYPVLDDGYGTRRRWFGAGIVLDLSKVIDVEINGDIWLLTSSGKLEKYTQGVPGDFDMDGFPSVGGDGRFSDPIAVSVTEENVYVLERGGQRVVVFNLEGKYVRQYVSEQFSNGNDLVVYEGVGYMLVGDRVLQFSVE